MKTEAAIIGGGPAGLIVARELARLGIRATVFEEHSNIGEPNHCTGILSIEGLRRIGFKPNNDFIQNEIKGGKIYSPNGSSLYIIDKRNRAYVVDRTAFDSHLAEIACVEGANIKKGTKVSGLLTSKDTVCGVKTIDDFHSKIVINCEGIKGRLAAIMNFPKPNGVISGINVEVSGVEVEQELVEVWFGKKIAPGFFAWVVPTGGNCARVGLGCRSGNPWFRLLSFLDKRFRDYKVGKPVIWPIITGGPITVTHCSGMLLVGDVAGQVKPTTAGGVIMGGLCAIEAASVASKALELEDSSYKILGDYDEKWKKKLGKEFSTMLKTRRVAEKISDSRLDKLFEASKKAGLEEVATAIIGEGDMDMQSNVIQKALMNPKVIRVGLSILGRAVFSELLSLGV